MPWCHSEIHCRNSREAVTYRRVQEAPTGAVPHLSPYWGPRTERWEAGVGCHPLRLLCRDFNVYRIKATRNTKDDSLCNNSKGKYWDSLLQPVTPGSVAVPTHNSWIYPKKYSFEKTHWGHIRVLKSEQRLKPEWSVNEHDTYQVAKKREEERNMGRDRITFWVDFPNISLYFWVHFQYLKTHKCLSAKGRF